MHRHAQVIVPRMNNSVEGAISIPPPHYAWPIDTPPNRDPQRGRYVLSVRS